MEETNKVPNVQTPPVTQAPPPQAIKTPPPLPTQAPVLPKTPPVNQTPPPKMEMGEKKPKKKLTKKAIYLIIAGIVIVILLIVGGAFAYNEFFAPAPEFGDAPDELPVDPASDEEDDVPVEVEEEGADDEVVEILGGEGTQVAYMKESNIYIVDGDGSDTVQVTDDGTSLNSFYTAIGWKGENELGYTKCDGSCLVYVYDLTDETSSLEFTPPPFTQRVSAMTWSSDGDDFAYIWQKADGSHGAMINDEEVAQFGISPGRGGSMDDGVEVYFSPDGSKVLFLNTVGNEVDPSVILANALDASVIISVTSATFPTFDGNLGFYFKHDNKIKHYSFASGVTSNAYDFGDGGGHNLETSPDGIFVSYWAENDAADSTELIGFDVAGSPFAIRDDIANAKWYGNSNVLVGLKQGPADDDIGMFMYQTVSLVKFNRIGGAELVLADGGIYEFEVEPQ